MCDNWNFPFACLFFCSLVCCRQCLEMCRSPPPLWRRNLWKWYASVIALQNVCCLLLAFVFVFVFPLNIMNLFFYNDLTMNSWQCFFLHSNMQLFSCAHSFSIPFCCMYICTCMHTGLLEYMRLSEHQAHTSTGTFPLGRYKALLHTVTIAKCFHAKLWENSAYAAKQLQKIGGVYSAQLVCAGKTTLKSLEATDARIIEAVSKYVYMYVCTSTSM